MYINYKDQKNVRQESESVKLECDINGWTDHGPITGRSNVLNYEPLLPTFMLGHLTVETQAIFLGVLEPWDRRLWFTVMIYRLRSK